MWRTTARCLAFSDFTDFSRVGSTNPDEDCDGFYEFSCTAYGMDNRLYLFGGMEGGASSNGTPQGFFDIFTEMSVDGGCTEITIERFMTPRLRVASAGVYSSSEMCVVSMTKSGLFLWAASLLRWPFFVDASEPMW